MGDVEDPKLDQIAAPELAIDRKVEQHQVSDPLLYLQSNPDSPNRGRLQRFSLPEDPALVPGATD